MGAIASQITSLAIVYSTVYSDADQRKHQRSKDPRHWPLCGEFTGDGWIPRTNGQWRGKCFHLMTSSCDPITFRDVAAFFENHIQPSLYTSIGNLKIPYILPAHDDVMKWKRFPYHWPFVRGSHRLLMYPLLKGPIIRYFGISLMLTRPKCWRNTQVAGEMPWCSYDITVMDKSPTLTAIVTKA